MFGFGTKKWEDNEEWYNIATLGTYEVYSRFFVIFSVLYHKDNLTIDNFNDLKTKLLDNPNYTNPTNDIEKMIQMATNIGSWSEQEHKTTYENLNKILKWYEKNEPTNNNYIIFRKKHLEILKLSLEIYKQIPLISRYVDSIRRISSYSSGKLNNIEFATYQGFIGGLFTVIYELSLKLSKLINNDISNEYEEIKKKYKK